MTHYPQFEVAISDTDRAEIEAIFIELMRERDAATENGSEPMAMRRIHPQKDSGAQ